MVKRFLFVLSIACSSFGNAQDFSTLWQGHFSYFNVIDVTKSDTKIYAASENAIFSYDVNTRDIETITTVEGLSGEPISTIEYSVTYQVLLIGYKNGLIEVYFESDQSFLSVVDILEKESIDPTIKSINDFNEHEGLVYIATDFGISIYDLDRLEFGDTYFIGNGNTQIPVEKTTVFQDAIYAACNSGNGVRKGLLSNTNLIDSQEWQTITLGSFVSAETIENRLYVLATNRVLSEITNDAIAPRLTFNSLPIDSETTATQLIYTTGTDVFIYNASAALNAQISQNDDFETNYTSAISFGENIYVGTERLGVLTKTLLSTDTFQEIRPEGPLLNAPFKLQAFREGLWVTYGEYNGSFNPYPLTSRGVSILNQGEWQNIPFDRLLGMRELNVITINPFSNSQVFVSSFIDGILEFNDFEPTNSFVVDNSPLITQDFGVPGLIDVRVGASKFDINGNLWSIQSRVDPALKSYNPSTGNWQLYSFSPIIANAADDEVAFTDLEIDDNTGIKWIGSVSNGLIAYNETLGSNPIKKIETEQNGLTFPFVSALALDNSNQLWIGTFFGLRVLFDTSNEFFNNENVEVEPIIFIEDGLARELLENQFITDIEIDGSNNKWVGTFDSGVFYFTPDGQTTIYHFTKDNSPLPSNIINDISIDQSNGTVYFATPNGLLSFRAGGSAPVEDLESVYAYPNPVRPEYDILGANNLNDINKGVKIVGLTDNINIKITDIEGNLVAEAQSRVNRRNSNLNYNLAIDGGTAIWNGKNLANNIVASGVYLILISDLSTFEDKVIKLLVIR